MAAPESALKGRNAMVLAIIARNKMNCILKGDLKLNILHIERIKRKQKQREE
jgi:hypothetical protein